MPNSTALNHFHLTYECIVELAGAVEYIDCIFTEGQDITYKCPWYDIKQSDGEVPVMLGLWRMWSTTSLSSSSLWFSVEAPDSVLSMRQIEQNCVLLLNWIAWIRTVFTL